MPVNSFILIDAHDDKRVLENINNIKRVIEHTSDNPHCSTRCVVQTYDDEFIRSTNTVEEVMRAIGAEMQAIANAFKGSISL